MPIVTASIALAAQATKKRRLPKPPPLLHPRQIERTFAKRYAQLAKEFIRQVNEQIIPALPAMERQADLELGRADSVRSDAWYDTLAPLLDIIRIGIQQREGTAKAMAVDIGQRTSEWNNKEWQKILRRTVGVGLLTAEPGIRERLRLFTDTNANLITKMQQDKINNIRGMVERGFSQGLRHTEIAKQVEAEASTSVSRARLIARDQVSKLNGQLTQMRQQQAGISKYIWQTSEDARVRATHDPLDGKLCRWDMPSLYAEVSEPTRWFARSSINAVELHPGQDFQCRCFAEPYIEELVDAPVTGQEPKAKKKRKKRKTAKKKAKPAEVAPGYVPVKKREDGENWARAAGVSHVNYNTSDISQINELNWALSEYKAAGHQMPTAAVIDYKPFKGRPSMRGTCAYYSPSMDSIVVNPRVTKKTMKQMHLQHEHFWMSTDSKRHIFRHELGHAAHYKADRDRYGTLRSNVWTFPDDKKIALENVSRYGATSTVEFVAETYAGLQDGKKYPKDVMSLYERVGGPKV